MPTSHCLNLLTVVGPVELVHCWPRQTSKDPWKSRIDLCHRNPPVIGGSFDKGIGLEKVCPVHEVCMVWFVAGGYVFYRRYISSSTWILLITNTFFVRNTNFHGWYAWICAISLYIYMCVCVFEFSAFANILRLFCWQHCILLSTVIFPLVLRPHQGSFYFGKCCMSWRRIYCVTTSLLLN